jgi:NADH-quinone oxidoreductase subunit C
MGKITNEELLAAVKAKFESDVTSVTEPFGLLTFETSREKIIDLLTFLKTDAKLQFIYLTDITAIHYPSKKSR